MYTASTFSAAWGHECWQQSYKQKACTHLLYTTHILSLNKPVIRVFTQNSIWILAQVTCSVNRAIIAKSSILHLASFPDPLHFLLFILNLGSCLEVEHSMRKSNISTHSSLCPILTLFTIDIPRPFTSLAALLLLFLLCTKIRKVGALGVRLFCTHATDTWLSLYTVFWVCLWSTLGPQFCLWQCLFNLSW